MSDPCRLTSNKYYKTWGGSNFSRNAKSTPKLDYPKLTRIWTTPSLTKVLRYARHLVEVQFCAQQSFQV